MTCEREILGYLYAYGNTREDDLLSFGVHKLNQPAAILKSALDEMVASGTIRRVVHRRLEPQETYLRADNPRNPELENQAMDYSLKILTEDLSQETVELQGSPRAPNTHNTFRMDIATRDRLQRIASIQGESFLSYIKKNLEQLLQSGQISIAEKTKEKKIEDLPTIEKLVELGLDHLKALLDQNEETIDFSHGQYSIRYYIDPIIHDFWREKFPDEQLWTNPLARLKLEKAEEEISLKLMREHIAKSLPPEKLIRLEQFEKKSNEEIVNEICTFSLNESSIFDHTLRARNSLIDKYLSQEYYLNNPELNRYLCKKDHGRMNELTRMAVARLSNAEKQAYQMLQKDFAEWAEKNGMNPVHSSDLKMFLTIRGIENTPTRLKQELLRDTKS